MNYDEWPINAKIEKDLDETTTKKKNKKKKKRNDEEDEFEDDDFEVNDLS